MSESITETHCDHCWIITERVSYIPCAPGEFMPPMRFSQNIKKCHICGIIEDLCTGD